MIGGLAPLTFLKFIFIYINIYFNIKLIVFILGLDMLLNCHFFYQTYNFPFILCIVKIMIFRFPFMVLIVKIIVFFLF